MIRKFAAVFVLILAACGQQGDGDVKIVAPPSAYDRIMQSQTIRCGYIIYPPHFMRDPNTRAFSGTFFDLTNEMAKRLSLKVQWVEEVSWGTYIEGLKTGRYDMVCSGAWSSAAEGREVGYSRPLFYSPFFVYVRGSDTRFDEDIRKLDSPRVAFAVGDGNMASIIARADFPQATLLSQPQMSDMGQAMENVALGKADATLLEPYAASLFLKNNPGLIKPVHTENPLRVFPNRYVLPLGDAKLKSMIDTALEEMQNSGGIDPLIAKYESFPGSFLRAAKPYQAGP